MPKNVRNLSDHHLRVGDWFFAPAGNQNDTVRGVDEAKIPAEVLELTKGAKPFLAVEDEGAASKGSASEPLVVADDAQ